MNYIPVSDRDVSRSPSLQGVILVRAGRGSHLLERDFTVNRTSPCVTAALGGYSELGWGSGCFPRQAPNWLVYNLACMFHQALHLQSEKNSIEGEEVKDHEAMAIHIKSISLGFTKGISAFPTDGKTLRNCP